MPLGSSQAGCTGAVDASETGAARRQREATSRALRLTRSGVLISSLAAIRVLPRIRFGARVASVRLFSSRAGSQVIAVVCNMRGNRGRSHGDGVSIRAISRGKVTDRDVTRVVRTGGSSVTGTIAVTRVPLVQMRLIPGGGTWGTSSAAKEKQDRHQAQLR